LRDKRIFVNFDKDINKHEPRMDSRNNFDPKELLKPENMLRLYASGAFPMADDKTGAVNWYMPELRTIIPLDNYNFPRSARKAIERKNFEIKFDSDFTQVIMGCSDREETWISQELIDAYKRLRKRGHIHTVETWLKGELVGGLYGVTFRGAFFGESMFSQVSQASKAALMALIKHLIEKDYLLLDVQYMTEHLQMFGAIEISFEEYTELLHRAYTRGCEF
jgi:leucyl/phenylalanyl-tRNA--protein transferase